MKIIFFGTTEFAAKILSHLFEEKFDIAAIVTRPDRPSGRSLLLNSPPVKQIAHHYSPAIRVYQPEKASTPDMEEILKAYHPDLFVVVAFGEIIKKNLLSLPKKGCINIHASLLPKYRGAAPMQRALIDGVKETGVSIIDMVLQMDAGDILAEQKIFVPENMTFGELEKKLCTLSCEMLPKVIHDLKNGTINRIVQDPAEVTFAAKITPEEEQIQWDLPATVLHNRIRALAPKPGAWCSVKLGTQIKRLKIKQSSVVPHKNGSPGSIITLEKADLVVACGEDALRLYEVQLEGKKSLAIQDFIKGYAQISFISFIS